MSTELLFLEGFAPEQAAHITAVFERLTRDWPGGWERWVRVLNLDTHYVVLIAGWDRFAGTDPDLDSLVAWMETYWS